MGREQPAGRPGAESAEPTPEPIAAPTSPPTPVPDHRVGPVCRRCVPFLVQHRKRVLAVALGASLVGAFFSARLYGDLRSNIEELLPSNARSVVAARTLGPMLHTVTHLSIVLQGNDPDGLERLADDLAGRLRAFPSSLVESIEYRTDTQEAFLRRFGSLYLSADDLRDIQRRLDRRIAYEKHRANPFIHLFGDEEGPPPPLDFSDIEKKYNLAGALTQFRKGYFQTPDGHLLVILVRPPESVTGTAENKKLLDAVKQEVERTNPKRYDPTVRVGYDGEVASLVEEQQALVSDLASSTLVVVGFVLLALWIYFRRWTAILSISGALAAGCALTFGASYFLVGHLNANTAFLGSIVVGNGINVSIIVVARYLEERRHGTPVLEALQLAYSGTVAATFIASFGAGLAYLSLSATDFRGFNQFGIIGGLGMALCWVTAYLLLPPLLATLDRRDRKGPASRRLVLGAWVAQLVKRRGRLLRIGSLVLLAGSAVAAATYRGDFIEYDLEKLRSAMSASGGAIYWGKKVDEVFRSYLTPIVIVGDTPAGLRRVVATLDADRRALGQGDPLREVRTLDDVLPQDQSEKIPLLRTLRATLTDGRLALLDAKLREQALTLRPPKDLRLATLDDLPATIRLPLTDRNGEAGRIALAYPKLLATSLGFRELHSITSLIRGAIDRDGGHAQAVGQSLLFEDIASAIWRDGPRATLIALALVCLLVVGIFRMMRPSLQVIGSLLLGVAWLVGAAAAFRVRLNFLNFVVLSITFGIGVDYAVNIVQRLRQEGPGSLERVLRETGGAVALCSATTIIGYASLIVADNRALRGFGVLASFGEVACLTAALVALPAWMMWRPRSRARG